jgi:hypothetical protein
VPADDGARPRISMQLDEYRVQVFAERDAGQLVIRNDEDEILLPDYQVEQTVAAVLSCISMTDWASFEDAEDRILQLAAQRP